MKGLVKYIRVVMFLIVLLALTSIFAGSMPYLSDVQIGIFLLGSLSLLFLFMYRIF